MSSDKPQIYQFATNPVCSPYRFDIPRAALNQRSRMHVTAFQQFDATIYETLLSEADMLILQRLPMSEGLTKICSALNSRGKVVVFEIDDDLLHLSSESTYAQPAPQDYQERLRETIRACQAVQCTTPGLMQIISEMHPEVAVLENQLDRVPPYRSRGANGPIVIAYAAGEHHLPDWLTIKEAYNRTIVELESEGYEVLSLIIGDRRIFDSITSANKQYLPLLSRGDYLEVMQNVDLSIVPLADLRFNESKSDIKFLESAACGATVIASDLVYSKSVQHEETGILFHSSEEFSRGLARLVREPEMVARLSQNAWRYVAENRLMRHHVGKWEATYMDWLERKDDLLQECPGSK